MMADGVRHLIAHMLAADWEFLAPWHASLFGTRATVFQDFLARGEACVPRR